MLTEETKVLGELLKPEFLKLLARAILAECEVGSGIRNGELRQQPMFSFAQGIRGYEALKDFDAFEIAELLELLFRKDETFRDLNFGWESFGYGDARAHFIAVYPIIKFPKELFAKAIRDAKQNPVRAPESLSPKYDFFCSLCAAVQRVVGTGEPFILSTTRFAEAVGVDRSTVSSVYIKNAVETGLLHMTQKATPRLHAARYLFIATEETTEAPSTPLKVSEGSGRTLKVNKGKTLCAMNKIAKT